MKHPDARIAQLLETLAHPALATIDLSLDRVTRLLDALGRPQDRLPPVIHVAGTNGKGSLVAYLTAILEAAGYRVHRYTSPFLVKFNESIYLAGNDIDDAALRMLLERVAEAAAIHPVTFFEAVTIAAFVAFAEAPGDVVLLETGLGGRLDATNIIAAPALTAITPVSLDHQEFLGDTVAQIAGEKAGIIKQGVPCVVGPQMPEALIVIERAASQKQALLSRYDVEWGVEGDENGLRYRSVKGRKHLPLPNLPGEHQWRNAATAVACIERLADFSVSDAHLAYGLTHAVWPARLQRLTRGALVNFLTVDTELWLDGGHNPDAASVLAQWLKRQEKPVHVICGMLGNKDIDAYVALIAPWVKSLTAVPIEGKSEAAKPERIVTIAKRHHIPAGLRNNLKDAIQCIVIKKEKSIILICGSLYLAGNSLWQNSQSS